MNFIACLHFCPSCRQYTTLRSIFLLLPSLVLVFYIAVIFKVLLSKLDCSVTKILNKTLVKMEQRDYFYSTLFIYICMYIYIIFLFFIFYFFKRIKFIAFTAAVKLCQLDHARRKIIDVPEGKKQS